MITVRANMCPANHPCPSVHTCPVGAISQDASGVPVVDRELCTECGMCTYSCPVFVDQPVAAQAGGYARR